MDTNYNIQYVYPQTIILYECTQNSELRILFNITMKIYKYSQ